MKYEVIYTAGAKKDLRNIYRYISEELLAPENLKQERPGTWGVNIQVVKTRVQVVI